MSWRTVVISNRAKLDLQLNYLVVRNEDINKIFLSEISILIIESTAVSMTAALLCELIKRKIKVIFCDEKRNPSSELLPYYGSHDSSSKIRDQIAWSQNIKDFVWTEIVTEKIRKQRNLLSKIEKEEESRLLSSYIAEIQLKDATNREGHAAKVYFNGLFGLEFTRTADIPINASLNYGYAILASAFSREIVANGYLTQLGIFHDNMFNQFNFSYDLIEPFRPLIDYKVIKMNPQKFDAEEKIQLLSIINEEVTIDGKNHYVNNAIKIYCKSVLDALNDEDISKICFYSNEL
ncbi:type II CRISPR-associated endonuclease Cas1 [Fusobacterium sp. PH5-44]|uniref:type II CRISPR-associated endonuclease Cas1 n=1 Tax=unclassified Fusobacterium TaxID=2648384 RepID=UPI003D1D870D